MVADQRKKRLSAVATSLSNGSQEQYRAKKRAMKLKQCDFRFNPHVSLKWDDNGKRVVAKEEQVGLSWRHFRSFVPMAPKSNTKLADSIIVPREVFELDDLTGVLSNEVWESLLSEKERGYLSQFLPQELDPDQVLQALFGGDNFHFGSPSFKWGAKLCSGDLHPDAIAHHERYFKTNKKQYYSELQQYHDSMIRKLQKVKERCARSKDPKAEILQMTSRSRRYDGKNVLPYANGIRPLKPEDTVAAKSESLSSIPDEKLYYSDNQKLSVIRDAEIQRRVRNEEAMMDKHERLSAQTSSHKFSSKHKKVDKLQKTNTISNDGAKYMSYVKISKKQHELVRSMKQSGSCIQSRSLNRVLGNLTSFNVKPYEMFVEEEQSRIHEHWSNLANNDLPSALQNWRDRQSERKQIISYLLHELEEKLRLAKTDEILDKYDSQSEAQDEKLDHNDFHVQSQDENLVNPGNGEETDSEDADADNSQGPSDHQQDDDPAATQSSTSSDERNSNPYSTQNDSSIQNPSTVVYDQGSAENAPSSIEEEVHLSPVKNQSSAHNLTFHVNDEFHPTDLNPGNSVGMELDTSGTCSTTVPPDFQVAPQISEASLNTEGLVLPGSSVKNVWATIGLPESYHRTIPSTTQYASSGETSFRHLQFLPNQPASLINLDSDLREEETTKDLLNRHSIDHIPFFNPYPNRDRSELLHSLIKRDTYHPEQKKTSGLEFHPTSNVLMEPTQFHSQFRNQMAMAPSFVNPNIQESIYSVTRYPIQGQEHFQTLNVRDWANNTRLPAPPPIQAPQLSSGDLSSHNWFASDNRAHNGGWSASESTVFSSSSLGSSGDQSLYSVLTQCNTLRAQPPPFIPVGPTNYGQDMTEQLLMSSSSNNIALPQTVSPFDYLSGNEVTAAASLQNNSNIGWISSGHQNPGLQDPPGRPFFKSWNQ